MEQIPLFTLKGFRFLSYGRKIAWTFRKDRFTTLILLLLRRKAHLIKNLKVAKPQRG